MNTPRLNSRLRRSCDDFTLVLRVQRLESTGVQIEFVLYMLEGPVMWRRISDTGPSLKLKHASKISICLFFFYTKTKKKKSHDLN